MSRPTPTPDRNNASSGPRGDVGGIDRLEAAMVRVTRRLGMVTRLGDLAMTLAEAVHERALAEEAAAKAALALPEAVRPRPDEEPPASAIATPSRSDPSQDEASQSARSGDRTRAAPRARTASRAGCRAAALAPVMTASALFARLSDTVLQCLELEIRIEEELRRLEAVPFVTHGPDAILGGPIEDAPQDAARNRVGAMVEAVIEEQAKTRQEARDLYAALRERLDQDEAYQDLASRPDVVQAARLCRDLGLNPNLARWPPPPPDQDKPPPRRPRSSPFNRVSRKPILAGSLA